MANEQLKVVFSSAKSASFMSNAKEKLKGIIDLQMTFNGRYKLLLWQKEHNAEQLESFIKNVNGSNVTWWYNC